MEFIEVKVSREFCDYSNRFVSELDFDDNFCGNPETVYPYCDGCAYLRSVEVTRLLPVGGSDDVSL